MKAEQVSKRVMWEPILHEIGEVVGCLGSKRQIHWAIPIGVVILACMQDERSGNPGSPVSVANGTEQPALREGQAGLAGWRSGP